MDKFIAALLLMTCSIAFLALKKPLSKIKKISIQNLVIETEDKETELK